MHFNDWDVQNAPVTRYIKEPITLMNYSLYLPRLPVGKNNFHVVLVGRPTKILIPPVSFLQKKSD